MQADTRPDRGLFAMQAPLILASASARRRQLLAELGLEFKVLAALVPEEPLPGEAPAAHVLRLAAAKARAISRQYPRSWVLGADTIVVFNGEIIGKPADPADAQRLLNLLAGGRHEVLTGFCLCRGVGQPAAASRVVRTEVEFAPFGRELAAAYVATGEPLDKAGAYGIQGLGGFLVAGIFGSYSNVVGLPLADVVAELLAHGIIAPQPT